jgi:hypothetical protein
MFQGKARAIKETDRSGRVALAVEQILLGGSSRIRGCVSGSLIQSLGASELPSPANGETMADYPCYQGVHHGSWSLDEPDLAEEDVRNAKRLARQR